MKILLQTAAAVETLLEDLYSRIFSPPTREEGVFTSHALFVPNAHGRSCLQEFFLKRSQKGAVANIHYLEWGRHLGSLLQEEETPFSREVLVLLLGIFLKESLSEGEPEWKEFLQQNASFTKNSFLWGQYYYDLYLEYELLYPEFLGSSSNTSKHLHLSEKSRAHKALYHQFWDWLAQKIPDWREYIPYSFAYPKNKILHPSLATAKTFHLFLPQHIFRASLQLIKEIIGEKKLYIYLLDSSCFSSLTGDFRPMEDLSFTWKAQCEALEIDYEEVSLGEAVRTRSPVMEFYSLPSVSLEIEDLLEHGIESLQENPSLPYSQYGIIFPNTHEGALIWERIFGPYRDSFPTHFLSLRKSHREYDILEILKLFCSWKETTFSLEHLGKILYSPMIEKSLGVSLVEIQTFVKFLQKHKAYGEGDIYPKENRLSYHMDCYSYRNIIDIPSKDYFDEISSDILSFSRLLIEKTQSRWVSGTVDPVLLSDIEELEEFLELIFPAYIWKELDISYVRRDMLTMTNTLTSVKELLQRGISLSLLTLRSLLFEKDKKDFYKENLVFLKRRGLLMGMLEDRIPFPQTVLRFPFFSCTTEFSPLNPFHPDSCIKELLPSLENQIRQENWNHFLHVLFESTKVEFSCSSLDPLTQQPLRPHFLITLFKEKGWLEIRGEKKSRGEFLDPPSVNSLKENSPFLFLSPSHERYAHIKELYYFLKNPLRDSMKRFLGPSDFLSSLRTWTSTISLFPTEEKQEKLILEKVFLQSFYREEGILDEYIKTLQNSFRGGILRKTLLGQINLSHEKSKAWNFLRQIDQEKKQWGQYYSHIFVGSYLSTSTNSCHLILDGVNLGGQEWIGELYHTYLDVREDTVTFTFPNIFLQDIDSLSWKMLLQAFLCGISMEKKEIRIRVLFCGQDSAKNIGWQEHFMTFQRHDIITYLSSCIAERREFCMQPVDLWMIRRWYQDTKGQIWDAASMSSFYEKNLEEDFLIQLFSLSSQEKLLEKWTTLYRFIFDSLGVKSHD